jgi:hypothetical membrane protein
MTTHATPFDRPAVGTSERTGLHALALSGTLLALAGAAILLAIITAEALYPAAYATGTNEISDLGGTRPPTGLVYQPSATIFDVAMIAVGLVVAAASLGIHRSLGRRAVTIPMAVLGLGALGVGLFPGNTGTPHAVFAMITFVSGGVAAITAGLVTKGPFHLLTVALGVLSLGTLAAQLFAPDAAPLTELGIGGVERWIVYPIVIWLIGFGGYLAGRSEA